MERTKKEIDMDYEQKYNEALERFKTFREKYCTYGDLHFGDVIFDKTGEAQKDLDAIFPELKESEDERIKKGLIELIENWNYPQELFTTKRNIIAYLKKQKEQEHLCDSAQFEEGFKTGYELGLRKKEEQKPAEWSEEDETMLRTIISDGSRGVELDSKQISWLKSLRPTKDCSSCAKHLEGYISGRSDAENKLLEQFGALITPEDELHIKPRWKPSEQEKGALRTAIHILTEERNFPKAAAQLQNILVAFEGKESRKDWKPSEEQIKALYCALNDAISLYSDKVSPLYEEISRTHFDALESLYNDLKKL